MKFFDTLELEFFFKKNVYHYVATLSIQPAICTKIYNKIIWNAAPNLINT